MMYNMMVLGFPIRIVYNSMFIFANTFYTGVSLTRMPLHVHLIDGIPLIDVIDISSADVKLHIKV